MALPAKVYERISTSLKRFQPILDSAKTRDLNESDTVIIITDMLEQMFGYEKYSDITSEHAIRGTFCDLAVKVDAKLAFLVEAKAIGLELKDQHVKQAVDYASNQGVEWVCLTNGVEWRIYKITFSKPINFEVIAQFNILNLTHRKEEDIELVGLLAKEGWKRGQLEEFDTIKQILNRFNLGAILLSDPVLKVIKKQIRRISNEVKVDEEQLKELIKTEIIKREILEGDKAAQAQKLVAKAEKNSLRKLKDEDESDEEDEALKSKDLNSSSTSAN